MRKKRKKIDWMRKKRKKLKCSVLMLLGTISLQRKKKRRLIWYYRALEMPVQKEYLKTIEQNISIIHQWLFVENSNINVIYLQTKYSNILCISKKNDVRSSKKVIQENARIFLDCLFNVPKTLICTLWKIIFKIFSNENVWEMYDTTYLLDNPDKS